MSLACNCLAMTAEKPAYARLPHGVTPLPAPQSHSSPGGHGLVVEALDVRAGERHAEAWDDLASRCLEPNPFMASGFCLPAALHLASAASPTFLMAWDALPEEPRRLLAVCPVVRPGRGRWPLSRVWFHDLAALGAPLLDRDDAEPALLAILHWIERHWRGQAALSITAFDRHGATAGLLERVAGSTGRRIRFLDGRRRAVLFAQAAASPAGLAALSSRRSKELLRQRRRLAERGDIAYASATAYPDVVAAMERFMVLEGQGWKGLAGTALAGAAARAAFTRSMAERMAMRHECRIDSLLLDGKPIAMGVVLVAQDRHYFWKTAFAEDYAASSPGVQFVLELTLAQQSRSDVVSTDSCASPDHPMIDRLWPGRLLIADAVMEIASARRRGFAWALGLELARRRMRAQLKALYLRLKRRRPP